METLKKIVTNQYFPAAAVLTAVLLFWTIAMFGGLSLLHNNQPPMATLTWMLFVYVAAVLTPLAGVIAAADLIRRWRRNRRYAQLGTAEYDLAEYQAGSDMTDPQTPQDHLVDAEPAGDEQATREAPAQAAPETSRQSAAAQPVQRRPATHQPGTHQPAKNQQTQPQQQTQPKQRKTAA